MQASISVQLTPWRLFMCEGCALVSVSEVGWLDALGEWVRWGGGAHLSARLYMSDPV